jgi:hypothetical protein
MVRDWKGDIVYSESGQNISRGNFMPRLLSRDGHRYLKK